MKIKSVLRFVGVILIALGVWYFFIKGYNYQVSFVISQPQGIIYDNLNQWNDGIDYEDTIVTTLEREPFSKVVQHYKFGDSTFKIKWNLKMIDPNTTKVTAKIKNEQNSIIQNLLILLPDNHFKAKSISTVKKFAESSKKVAKRYKLNDIKNGSVPAQHCLYIHVKSKASEKAPAMLNNIFYAMNYIKGNDSIQLTSHPFLEVTKWDIEKDSLEFDFCFPINKMDRYPELPSKVKIKQTEERKALMTNFNGNYELSDRAWYQLADYARYNGIKTTNLPVEIFQNDPHSATNPLEWVAEVFLPIE